MFRLSQAALPAAVALFSVALLPARSVAECDEEPPLKNFTGGGAVICPCFIGGEEAGAVLSPPAMDLPIEVLRVGIGWGSQFGGRRSRSNRRSRSTVRAFRTRAPSWPSWAAPS
jgi:hypothetical protein